MTKEDVVVLGNLIAKEVNSNFSPSVAKCNAFSAKASEDIMQWLEDYEIAAAASNWSDEQ